MAQTTQADKILGDVLAGLGLSASDPKTCYQNLGQINDALDAANAKTTMNVKTTGTINERLVKLALDGFVPGSWYPLTYKKFQWLGDFGVFGYPVNAIISVKSFKAKERLLASGTGSLLAPTIGWGRFDDPSEFTDERMAAYQYRSFVAIYMPQKTRAKLSKKVQNMNNFNRKPLIRDIDDFGTDIATARIQNKPAYQNIINFSDF